MQPLLLSGFADETSASKLAGEQLAAMAALGLRRYTLRFIDLGSGVKNAMALTDAEVQRLIELNRDFGLAIASLGSPIGKVKLCNIDDGTSNRYVDFDEYLRGEVATACRLANALGTRLVRGFSFYHPKGTDPQSHLPQVVDQLGRIAAACASQGLLFGLEVEANLVGQSGTLLAEIHRQVASPELVLVFDAANLLTQGYSPEETFAEYQAMKPGLGWLHVKDYRPLDRASKGQYVDEEALCEYRPVTTGSGVYDRVFADLAADADWLAARLAALGLPGLLVDLEPHVRGGGQFGGYSGADGMGIALRSLCTLLELCGVPSDLKTARDLV